MSTASVAVAASTSQVQQIPLGQLLPSLNNPRKTIDAAFLSQLADSIVQLGIQVPLLVRQIETGAPGASCKRCGGIGEIAVPLPQDHVVCPECAGTGVPRSPGYEIIAGHRRYEAAKIVKLSTLPCIVREMDDEEAGEIMLVENLQRADLSAMEEADAYEKLRATLGTAAAIAARVGKPVEYVTRRLKLLTLIPLSRQALAEKLITIDHALLLSKLAPAEQEQALRYAIKRMATQREKTDALIAEAVKRRAENRYGYWQPQSVLDLKSFIEREIKLELARAPWDLADASLVPSAGACAGCAKNTAANTALFGDLAIKDAVCTDAACFNAKRDAFVQIQLAAVKDAGKDAVRVSWKSTSAKPRALDNEAKYLAQVFKHGQWIEAKKGSCGFARTGVTVDFDEQLYGSPDAKKKPGMKLLVCVSATCKTHKKAWQKAAEHGQGNRGGYDAKAEEEKRKQRAEAAKAENATRLELAKKALAKIAATEGFFPEQAVRDLLQENLGWEFVKSCPQWVKALKSAPMDGTEFAQAVAMAYLYDCSLEVGDYQSADYGRKEFLAALKSLGVDGSSAWAKKPEKKAKREKEPTPGTCRYCGCTDEWGCDEGCEWVDPQNTVCSNPECVTKYEAVGRALPKAKSKSPAKVKAPSPRTAKAPAKKPSCKSKPLGTLAKAKTKAAPAKAHVSKSRRGAPAKKAAKKAVRK